MFKVILSLFLFGLAFGSAYGQKSIKSQVTCELCSYVLEQAQAMLENNYTDAEIIKFFESQLCSRLGALSSVCNTFFETDGKQILYELGQDIHPTIICKRIGLCSTDIKEETEAKPLKPLKDSINCEICTFIVGAARDLLNNNNTEAEVIQILEKDICDRLGKFSQSCVQYVDAYGVRILELLASKLDPKAICQILGACKKTVAKRSILTSIESFLAPLNSLNCTLCKLVFKQIQEVLESNKTQDKILEMLEQRLCNATGKDSVICSQLVKTFGPTLLEFVAKEVDPQKACELIGMCTASKDEVKPTKLKTPVNVNPLECVACEFIIHELDSLVQNNKTEAAIVKALEEVCQIVPSKIKQQCTNIIDTYGSYLVQLIEQLADPHKVCQVIRLC